MKITTVSNYINHHQIPLSNQLYLRLGEDYRFIQTEPMEEERVRMGWGKELGECPYLRCFYEKEKECRELIAESDIVIFGGVEEESYIEERLAAGKIVIRSSERLYKDGQWKAVSPRGLVKKYHDHTRYRKSPVYLLCDGGYVASDYHIVRAYPGKMFRWGYFPKQMDYDIEKLLQEKEKKIPEILWTGRFVPFKQPEYVVKLAERLKKEGSKAHITMIGGGELEAEVASGIEAGNLQDMITRVEFQPPAVIREYMEKADIYLFTSDYGEGWGVVANEAMNSGCAVIASHAAGATPFLIRNGQNGLIYRNGDFEEFHASVKSTLEQPELRTRLGREAYQTIADLWNPSNAAEALLEICGQLMEKGDFDFREQGPMSRAEVIAPGRMYRRLKNGFSGKAE